MSAARMITGLIGAFGGGTLGRMLGGRTGGMIGSMAGSMLSRKAGRGGGIGSMLGGLMGGNDDKQTANAAAADIAEDDAMVLIRAMCNAAKADGEVDDDEVNAILSRAGDLDDDDQRFLRSELQSPLDLDSFLASVPKGLEAEVYAASLLPITVDTPSEVQYMQTLASGLGLKSDQVAAIHSELGLG